MVLPFFLNERHSEIFFVGGEGEEVLCSTIARRPFGEHGWWNTHPATKPNFFQFDEIYNLVVK